MIKFSTVAQNGKIPLDGSGYITINSGSIWESGGHLYLGTLMDKRATFHTGVTISVLL